MKIKKGEREKKMADIKCDDPIAVMREIEQLQKDFAARIKRTRKQRSSPYPEARKKRSVPCVEKISLVYNADGKVILPRKHPEKKQRAKKAPSLKAMKPIVSSKSDGFRKAYKELMRESYLGDFKQSGHPNFYEFWHSVGESMALDRLTGGHSIL